MKIIKMKETGDVIGWFVFYFSFFYGVVSVELNEIIRKYSEYSFTLVFRFRYLRRGKFLHSRYAFEIIMACPNNIIIH